MGKVIGFLGGGNMGHAIIAGLIQAKAYLPEEILVYDISGKVLENLQSELNVRTAKSMEQVAAEAQIIVLSVKPQVLPSVLKQIGGNIAAEQLIISIAAGVTITRLEEMLSSSHKIVRVMPNTPALVGAGMAGVCANANVTDEEKKEALSLFSCLGKAQAVPEHLMDSVVGVSGSGPAYVYMFIEALADGAVLEGMPRSQAYTFAAQTVLGSAKMVLESGKHPGELKDMVCSPAGTTIEAVKVLEDNAFRSSVIKAVQAAAEKNRTLQ